MTRRNDTILHDIICVGVAVIIMFASSELSQIDVRVRYE